MKHIPNYELKSRLVGSDMLKHYIRVQKSYYFHYVKSTKALLNDGEILEKPLKMLPLRNAIMFDKDYSTNNPEEWQECGRIYSSHRQRQCTCEKHVTYMLLNGKCLFLTLTFTDNVLNSTSAETRRKYVVRFLKSYNTKYIANIDFGKKNGREHYHCILMTDRVNNKDWQYGAINFMSIIQPTDAKKLSSYINKLTNHAIKETTKRNHIIYSR